MLFSVSTITCCVLISALASLICVPVGFTSYAVGVKICTITNSKYNEQLAEELHRPVNKKFKRRKVYARFKDNIRAPGLAEMGSLLSKNKNVKFLLCIIDVFTKWDKPLRNEKGKTVLNAFIKILNEPNRKPNKLWVDQVRKFYNYLMEKCLDNGIFMHSTYTEGKTVIVERFIKILKTKIFEKKDS